MVELPELPELYDALLTTRAMRRFSAAPVSDAVVEAVLRAAVQAPSGGNMQPYEFLVVTDPARRAALGAIYLRAWQRYAPAMRALSPEARDDASAERTRRNWQLADDLAHSMGTAPPVLVFVLVPVSTFDLEDGEGVLDIGSLHASVYPAVQNLILAARAHGLGSVLTTVAKIYESEVRDVCGIPAEFEMAAMLPIGRPLGKWSVAPRRPAASLTSWNEFGDRRG